MKIGIIGTPQSGKTTVFRALCGTTAPDSRGSVNLATIKVPDKRIDRLAALYMPKKTIYAAIDFADFGIVIDAKNGLDAQTAARIKEMDALALVISAFRATDPAEPALQLKEIIDELILLDQVAVETRLERMKKDRNHDAHEESALTECLARLESGKLLRGIELQDIQYRRIGGFRFFTLKPILAVINETEERYNKTPYPGLHELSAEYAIELFNMSAPIEFDLSTMPPEEQTAFLEELGESEPARDRFIQAAYHNLNLISFFTVGEDEVRAWTIQKGTSAHRAAGKIHSDIEKGFIRAEVMRHEDLLELGSEVKIKEAGKFRLEGKEYIVVDGDIVHFRFNI